MLCLYSDTPEYPLGVRPSVAYRFNDGSAVVAYHRRLATLFPGGYSDHFLADEPDAIAAALRDRHTMRRLCLATTWTGVSGVRMFPPLSDEQRLFLLQHPDHGSARPPSCHSAPTLGDGKLPDLTGARP